MSTKMSLAELDEIVHRAGRELGWTSKYVDLLATTASSMYVAHGSPETLPVGRDVATGQIDVLRQSLEERNKSSKTAQTYASAWQRISTIVDDWRAAQSGSSEATFWQGFATKYRDPRIQRRRTRTIRPEASPADVDTAPSTTYQVDLASGRATMTLPDQITGDDAMALVDVIIKHRHRAERTP